MGIQLESGNLLPLVSLGGIVSQVNQGRAVDGNQNSVVYSTGAVQILWDNPRRISDIIQNLGPDSVVVYMTGSTPAIGCGLLLPVNASLQIDRDFPWTGAMFSAAGATGSLVNVVEVSIQ